MDTTFEAGLGGGRKATIYAIIIALHVLLVWALLTSLGVIVVERPPPIIKAEIIEEIQDKDEPPPPPPTIETPPPYVPPPEISIEVPVDAAPSTGALVVTNKPAPPPPPVAASGVKIAPTLNKKFDRNLRPDYPPSSRRLAEEGLVVVECFVNAEGKCQEVKLKTSSGFPKLDEAVLKHAPRAWRFNPGMEDGKPVPMWVTVPMRFRLTDE